MPAMATIMTTAAAIITMTMRSAKDAPLSATWRPPLTR